MRDIVAKLQSGCVAGNISHQIVVLGRDHPQWTKGLAFLLTFLLGKRIPNTAKISSSVAFAHPAGKEAVVQVTISGNSYKGNESFQ